jgi:hypothetical protein
MNTVDPTFEEGTIKKACLFFFEEGIMSTPNPQKRPKVLLIEDDVLFQELAVAALAAHSELLIAGTIEEGRMLLSLHDDIAILILDGHLPMSRRDPHMSTTLTLAEEVLSERAGHLLLFAASGDQLLNSAFVQLGAQPTDKSTAYATVARLLHGRKQ